MIRKQMQMPSRGLRRFASQFLGVILFLVAFAGSAQAQLQITTSSLPGGVVGRAYPPTVLTATGGTGTLTWCWNTSAPSCLTFVQPGTVPPGLSLSTDGIISGTPTSAGTYNFVVRVTDSSLPTAQTAQRSFTIIVTAPLLIATTSLPNGKVGTPYPSQSLTATGGTPPNSWSIISGALPPGLTLSGTGVISGTPTTTSGRFAFTVRVVDSSNPQQTDTRNLTIAVAPLITTPSPLPSGVVGTAYGPVTLTATPGDTPYTWSGTLPAGLTLSSAGVISGTPAAAGTFTFTVGVSDNPTPPTPPLTDSKDFAITIQPRLTITTASDLPLAVVGAFYSHQFTTTGPSPVTWSVISGAPPPGLFLSASGFLSGTPSVAGTFDFTLQAAGGNPQQTASQAFRLVVNPALTITTFATLPDATLSVPYSTTLNATGGLSPYAWAVVAGRLPTGLTLSSAGVISGTPTVVGNFQFVAQVSDSFTPRQETARTFQITVSTGLTITTASLPNGAPGVAYSHTLTSASGTPPVSWAVTAGLLPDGLTLSTNGIISGIPIVAGTFSVTISAIDSSSPAQTASKTFAIVIQPLLTIVTPQELPIGVVGAFYSRQVETSGPSPAAWSVISGILPPGIGLAPSGTLAGSPTVPGSFDFTLQATAGDPQQTVSRAFRLVINPAFAITTAAALPDAALSVPYSVSLAATGGVAPYTWTLNAGTLPPGLSLSSSGFLSGTPTGLGNFSFTLKAADSFSPQQEATRTFTLVVSNSFAITTLSLPRAIQNLQYSQQLQAVGGTSPFTWVVTSGALPTGLTLTTGGLLQGTPTAIGSHSVEIAVTDSRGLSSARTFVIVVDPPVSSLSVPNLTASMSPATQQEIVLSLAAPHPSPLSGQLVLSFTSNAEVPSDDPMTQFSTGSRTVNFTIPENTTTAVFPARILLLAGTVSGTVRLTANFQNGASDIPVATVEIVSVAPQITNVRALRTLGGLDVQITGYAPARRVTSVEFTFDITVGTTTQRQTFTKNVDVEFGNWYRSPSSTAFGSAFSFLQSFIVADADASTIKAVTIRLTNAQGSTSSAAIPFQ